MSGTTQTNGNADRNLLFGILALQMDFVSRDALIAGMNTWVLDKAQPLGQILLQQGTLRPEQLALLDSLVAEHLRAHQNDAQHSLAALSSVSSICHDLRGIADSDLQASLAVAGSAHRSDPEAARESKPGLQIPGRYPLSPRTTFLPLSFPRE